MEHLLILFNVLTLFAGLYWAGRLWLRWRQEPTAVGFWRLFHFLGFTATMLVAALDAYSAVNLGVGSEFTRLWSSAVLLATAFMTIGFPHLARAEAGRPRTRGFSLFWVSAAVLPLAGAVMLPLLQDISLILAVLAGSFLPFIVSVLYGLSVGPRPRAGSGWGVWLAFGVLVSLGLAEVWWVLSYLSQPGYLFLTIPVAYWYTLVSVIRTGASGGPLPLAGPSSLVLSREAAEHLGLTPRELEVGAGILRGLSNKELAFELHLSEHTVRNHISNLYRKLGIQKRLDLVLLVQKYQQP